MKIPLVDLRTQYHALAGEIRETILSCVSETGGHLAPSLGAVELTVALHSVLHSPRAVKVNIEIMRAFVQLRQLLATHTDLARRLEDLEKKYDAQFKVVFEAIRQLMTPPEPVRKEIGFHVRESKASYMVRRNKHHRRKT